MLGNRSIVYRWREPAVQAAIVNAAVIVPVAWLWYVDFTSEVVRPRPTTVWSSAIRMLPILLACGAIAPLIAWRTYEPHWWCFISGVCEQIREFVGHIVHASRTRREAMR